MADDLIDRALGPAVAAGAVPGLVASAVLPGGETYRRAFGSRGAADPAAMSLDTQFWIASMTKALTSVAALQLVERGLLALDEDAAKVLPALADAPILEGFDEAGAPRLRAGVKPITLRHLLTHTAGFGYPFMSGELARFAAQAGPAGEDPMALPRLFEAGDRWQYGVSTDFVGQMVEAASGEGLDDYLQRAVFDVLGLRATTFAPSAEQQSRQAKMHARAPGGALSPMPFTTRPPPNPMLGGGGLWSTAGDYLLFLRALLDGGVGRHGRLLTEPSLSLLLQNQAGAMDCGVLTSSNAALTGDFDPLPGVGKRWSLGFMVNEGAGPDGRGPGALAWAGLGNCYYWLDPAVGVAGVILMQILPFADRQALRLFARFERAVYGLDLGA